MTTGLDIDSRQIPLQQWEMPAVLLATLVGFVLRVWALWDVPPGLWYDEAINGLDALSIIRDPGLPIFFMTEGHPREPLYIYAELLGIGLFGKSAFAIRFVSALIGTATIPAVWWMARQIGGPRVAVWTLLFFAPMRWHVHFSRLAFRTILAPLFCALITGFTVRGLREQRTRDFVVAGALAALSLYSYLSMRLFIIALIIFVPIYILAQRDRLDVAILPRQLMLGVGAFILVFLPLGIDYVRNPEHFSGRQNEISLFEREDGGWGLVFRQARDVFLMPALRGDHVAKHNIPGPPRFTQTIFWSTDPEDNFAKWRQQGGAGPDVHGTGVPLFDVLTGLLFYYGMGVVFMFALKHKITGNWLVFLWIVFGSCASVFSFGAPNMLRLLFLAPAVAYALAEGLEHICRRLMAHGQENVAAIVALIFVAWFAMGERHRYFDDWPRHPAVWFEFNSNLAEAAEFLKDREEHPVTLVPQYILNAPTFKFITDPVENLYSDASTDIPLERSLQILAPSPPFPPVQTKPPEQYYMLKAREALKLPNEEPWAMLEIYERR